MLVVADDLTGAHDCAARLARPGAPVATARRVAALQGAANAPALVLDAETRFLGPRQARWQSARAWSALGQVACAPWRFQKLDSTLRGNPGPEVEGLAQATSAPWVAVLPAYPRAGRQTLGGRHLVNGVPLLRTEYAQDPLSPARVGRPQDLFGASSNLHAPLRWVRGGARRLASELRRAFTRRQPRFVTFDCAADRDVDSIARAALSLGCRHFAGASALAGALADAAGWPSARPALPPKGQRWLVLAGTVSAQSFLQLRLADEAGAIRWLTSRAGLGLSKACWRQGSLALSTLEDRSGLALKATQRSQESGPAIEGLIRRALRIAPLAQGNAYFLTGGHTALRFFETAGLERFDVTGEAQAGLALGVARGPQGQAWVATKPGGFGADDLFPRFLAQVGAR